MRALVREAYAGHKETSDESVIGGNLFGRVFFLDCPNYGVQFSPVDSYFVFEWRFV